MYMKNNSLSGFKL